MATSDIPIPPSSQSRVGAEALAAAARIAAMRVRDWSSVRGAVDAKC